MKLNNIRLGDCIENLKKLPSESVDLVFADPPYFLQLRNALYRPNQTQVDGVDDEWDQFENYQVYDKFTEEWLIECYRVLKKDGAIWVIGTYHNIFRVGTVMQNIGFWLLNDIIWIKNNPMPNFKGTRFNNAHETLIWATKSAKSNYTFHYQAMKAYNDGLQMRSDWEMPICKGKERIKINGQKAHSTQKPEELLYRILLATSNVGDLILDPFFGSGTTGAVAKKLQRNYIGLEREPFYIEVATQRIAAVEPLPLDLLDYKIEKKKPKVPFGCLIEKNYVQVGETLYSKNQQHQAVVAADASLVAGKNNETVGSIHKVSATLMSKENNNGWTFWYVFRQNEWVSIDTLREDYAKKYL